jgi:hypothetical protein
MCVLINARTAASFHNLPLLGFGGGPRLERTIRLYTCPVPRGYPGLVVFWLFIYLATRGGKRAANDWPSHMKHAFWICTSLNSPVVHAEEFGLNIDRRWSDVRKFLV